MVFWFIAALLTLGASLAVLLPMARRSATGFTGSDHEIEVYRDQFAELERDVARGLIQPAEAEQARAEIGRRILRADGDKDVARPRLAKAGRLLGAASVLAVPLISWGIYAAIGSPDMPSQPLSARLAQDPAKSSVEELMARAEAHLAQDPSDGRGWDVLAPIYLRIGRFAEAELAYRNAIRLLGSTADREAGLGEAIASTGSGLVSAEAQGAFERAVALQPDHIKARFFLASALAQEGRADEATKAWQAMLAGLPENSPWRAAVQQAMAQAKPAQPGPGPSEADVDAAAGMSAGDRNAMIETMVASLDEKLRRNPRDPEGWARLVRSYMVLGKTDAARDAVSRGLKALDKTSQDGAKFAEFAASLGIVATE